MDTFRSHPDFLAATQGCMRGLVGLYSGNRIVNRILNDRGRVLFGILALYLDARPDERGVGLTVTRIANLCHDLGICSRGRAKAIVLLMRWAGYLEVEADGGGHRRQRPLVPTARMMEMQVRRWRLIFGAVSRIDPAGEDVLRYLDDPAFCKALIRQMGSRFEAGFRLRHYAPEAILFAERDAGILIAWQLMISGSPGDVFPPERAVPVPVAALARQFFVSRAHVLKLLREAEQRGMLVRTPTSTGSVLLLEPMRRTMLDMFAAMFAASAEAGADAVAEYEGRIALAARTDYRTVPPVAGPFSM